MADERVVTELVIDADTSGADKYSQAMDRAGSSSKSFSESQSSIGLAVAGVSASLVAAFAAINSGLDYIAKLNKGLADMATQAKNTGLSLADIQGLKFGGAVTGLSDSQINSGLERSAQLLNDASRNSNSLSKELASNGISVREANGQLISQNKLLGIAADLVSRARNPGDQAAIAQMLGFTKEWIPLLEQGPVAMSGLTDEARKAGAVLDDEVIQRAVEFDKEWRKSSVEMEYYLKSALLALLPYVDDLIDRLVGFVKSIDAAKIAAGAEDHAKDVFGPGEAALKEAGVGGLEIGISPEFKQAINEFQNTPVLSLDFWAAAGRVFSNSVKIVSEQDIKWSTGVEPIRDTSSATIGNAIRAKAETDAWTAAGKSWKDYSSAVTSGAATISAGYSNVASRTKDTADAYDRAVESITKHTARTEADLMAVGKGAGAQEELRASYQLTTAAQLAGIPITQKMKDQIQDLAQDAGEAAAALKLARAQSDANFVSQTQFLPAPDKAAASAMNNLYNDEWQSHMDDALAKQIKMNVLLSEVKGTIEQSAASFANDFVSGIVAGKSAMDALAGAATSVGKSLTTAGINNIIKDPTSVVGYAEAGVGLLMQAFGGASEAQKKQEKARQEWAKTGPAFEAFLVQMSGGVAGSISSKFQQLNSQVRSFAEKAAEAEDFASINRMYDAFNSGVYKASNAFKESFGGMLDAINDGLGPNSPFSAASDKVKQVSETLKGFIDDVTVAYSNDRVAAATGGAALVAGGGESQIAAATAAAQKYLLTLLGQPPVLSATATAIQQMNGTAVQLRSSLTELGMSSGEAADAINKGVIAAMDALKKNFSEGLTSRLNAATGKGYLNDAAALLKQYQQDSADAASLGLDQAQVAAVFRAEAQKIVDDAGLIGDSFSGFIDLFPQFNGLVGQSATALAAATQKVQAFVKSLNDYLNNLVVGPNSTKSPADQLAAAQANFTAQMALARSGDEGALGTITQYATTLLDQAKSFYASSTGYTAIYDQVTTALKDLPGAIGAGDGTSKIVTAINSAANENQTLLSTQNLLMSTANSLATSQISLADSQVGILSSIQSLQSIASAQLNLLNQQYAASPITAPNGSGGTLTSNNLMVQALNKIVYNTYAIAQNTAGGSVKFGGLYADGGWITGGVPGRDSVPLANGGLGMPGEFVVRREIAQINTSWLSDFNSTGRLPSKPVTRQAGNNDNRVGAAQLDWQALARALKQVSDQSDERISTKLDELIEAINETPGKNSAATRRLVEGMKQRAS